MKYTGKRVHKDPEKRTRVMLIAAIISIALIVLVVGIRIVDRNCRAQLEGVPGGDIIHLEEVEELEEETLKVPRITPVHVTTTKYVTIQMPDLSVPKGQVCGLVWLTDTRILIQELMHIDGIDPEQYQELSEKLDIINLCIGTVTAQTGKGSETVAEMLAKIVTREIGGLDAKHAFSTREMERAAVCWCVLNRVKDDGTSWETLVEDIITAAKRPHAFAYSANSKIYNGTEDICVDVVTRYIFEQFGKQTDVGRVIPPDYLYFVAAGDGWHNTYRNEYQGLCAYWDWTLPDPYIMFG